MHRTREQKKGEEEERKGKHKSIGEPQTQDQFSTHAQRVRFCTHTHAVSSAVALCPLMQQHLNTERERRIERRGREEEKKPSKELLERK